MNPTTAVARHMLIVEDEPRMRSTLEEMVAALGFTSSSVASAEKAMRLLAERSHPLALIDLNLPGMTGMELFTHIRRQYPATQVVILTGFGDLEAARQAIRLDVVDFLTKPCHLGELEQALERAWRQAPGTPGTPPGTTPGASPQTPPGCAAADEPADCAADRSLADLEREHILATLDRHHDNRRAAAAALGISVRKLYYRLSQYGLEDR